MRRISFFIAAALTLSSCSLARSQSSVEPTQPWPPATGTVVAQTLYGRITSVEEGGYSIELRETPIPPDRPEAERAAAQAAIRAFAGAPSLTLTYSGLQRHPENSGIIVEVYDSPEAQFMVDVQDGHVVYMQAAVVPRLGPAATRLASSELKARARAFLADNNGCFESLVDRLQFEPGGKGDNSFFRWSNPEPDLERPWNQPTFVQVGIDAAGSTFGYIDSGICYLHVP